MTRRDLARLAAGAALLPQAGHPAPASYSGALDGSDAKVDLKNFDPVLFSRRLYESAPLRLTFRAQTKKQAEAWQKKLHSKLVDTSRKLDETNASIAQTNVKFEETNNRFVALDQAFQKFPLWRK